MSKIVKNNTLPLVNIDLKEPGVTILTTEDFEINPINYAYWATPEAIAEITPYINSGDLIINDGVRDLIVANSVDLQRAIDFLKYPDAAFNQRFLSEPDRNNGFLAKNTQQAIEEAKTTVSGKMQDFEFFTNGNTQNKWVNVGHPSDDSNQVPFVSLWSGKVIGISFVNSNDDSSTDLEFYVNGVKVYTYEVRNKRWVYSTNETGFFTLNQGDRLSIFAKKITGTGVVNPSGISGEVMAIVSAIGNSSGGSQTGV